MALVRAIRLMNNVTGGGYTGGTLQTALGNAVTRSDWQQVINVRSQARNLASSISGVTVAGGSALAATDICASSTAFAEVFNNVPAFTAFSSQAAGQSAIFASATTINTVKADYTRDLAFLSTLTGSTLLNYITGLWAVSPTSTDPFGTAPFGVVEYIGGALYTDVALWGGTTYAKTYMEDSTTSYRNWVTFTSDMGNTWSASSQYGVQDPTNGYRSILSYANGLWAAAQSQGAYTYFHIGRTPDTMLRSDYVGIPNLSSGFYVGKLVYGAGKWVMLGTGTQYVYSSDGVTWTTGTTPASSLQKLFFINGLFFAIGSSCQIYTSPDGVAWTARSTATGASSALNLFYENGRYFMTGTSGYMTSTDAVTWTLVTTNGTQIRGLKYFGGRYWSCGLNVPMRYSTDGTTWTTPSTIAGITNNTSINVFDIQVANGILFAQVASGILFTSLDGAIWTYKTSMSGGYILPNRGTIDTMIIQAYKYSYAVK